MVAQPPALTWYVNRQVVGLVGSGSIRKRALRPASPCAGTSDMIGGEPPRCFNHLLAFNFFRPCFPDNRNRFHKIEFHKIVAWFGLSDGNQPELFFKLVVDHSGGKFSHESWSG